MKKSGCLSASEIRLQAVMKYWLYLYADELPTWLRAGYIVVPLPMWGPRTVASHLGNFPIRYSNSPIGAFQSGGSYCLTARC